MTDVATIEAERPVEEAEPVIARPPAPDPVPEPEPEAAAPEAPAPVAPPPPATWSPPKRRPAGWLLIVAVAAAAALAVLYAWGLPPFGGEASTDNAYVRGRTTVIAPQVSGYVVEVKVRDYQLVRRGEILARIDDSIYRARVAQAEAAVDARLADLANSDQAHASRLAGVESRGAELTNARAQLERAQADMNRTEELAEKGWVTRHDRDRDLAALRQAQAAVQQSLAGGDIARQDVRSVEVNRAALVAQVEAARAQLRLAQIDLDHSLIRAPEDGRVGEVAVRLGQYVTNGTSLLVLVPEERWVIANFKEAQTRRIVEGQPVSFTVDALGGARFAGHVERVSPAAGSEFSVLRPDNATGNFIKVPQRIGVRIRIDPGQPLTARLRPGMSVEAAIDTEPRT
ncbi:MAG: HlyD family secretion protein [Alphaproteobacteria bacterium]|nr:HlyD family secretion protein [Alphaproteobacteria bacterium]MBV9372320.1 HlyD family secretion protein [Alphaproteobacteria bacterium]MBV9899612.1 HlyD family secretion protein [Alphaproteobacteria bacterium]